MEKKDKQIKGLILKEVLPESYPTEIYIGYVIYDRTGGSEKKLMVKNIQYNKGDRQYVVCYSSFKSGKKDEDSYHTIEKDIVGVVMY